MNEETVETIEIRYPPNIFLRSNIRRFGKWPTDSFSWLDGLMRESVTRTMVSPEILQYHAHVLGKAFVYPGLTRNVFAVEVILYFLHSRLGLQPGSKLKLLELCAGTGILTTPLAAYFKVVAIEKKEKYIESYNRYLAKMRLADRVRVIQADITQTSEAKKKVGREDFQAVVMNGPWDMTPHCFDIAQYYQPSIIIAVLPLDFMRETDPQRSYRYQSEPETIEKNRSFMSVFRDESAWKLVAVEPTLREDGTAQIGTMLFERRMTGRGDR